MTKTVLIVLGGLLFASWSAISAVHDHGCRRAELRCDNAPYLSGGIGEEERTQMQEQENNFNLKMIFVEKKTGAYLADVDVAITSTAGDKPFQLKSTGPILLVKLPPGTYEIDVSAAGKNQQRRIRIDTKKLNSLTFLWEPD